LLVIILLIAGRFLLPFLGDYVSDTFCPGEKDFPVGSGGSGPGGQSHFLPSRYVEFNAGSWWKDREDASQVFLEHVKMIHFYLSDRWG
jgi:hypothetical protein